ncbi:protein of unknown function [Parapedobacter composti]|uniref:DUF4886 domain-containing protein n=1 Tax=Parapedobacter composti TaxID=623281 RepID=A0A1I1GYB4_9SPHI|nr:DUF4886 domain-containing protein [Parapedobacter composti]SFC16515.1 protein of unknown function [Parapedobacter composti]
MKLQAIFCVLFALFGALLFNACISLKASGTAGPSSDSILRVLAIGNSFSADALETHLHGIARAAGVQMQIANFAAPGAGLDFHVRYATTDSTKYIYTKIEPDGAKKVAHRIALGDVLNTEDWDLISFQQVSHLAGEFETFEAHLPALVEHVRQHLTKARPIYALHQTWAYEEGCKHPGFALYNHDQQIMYRAVADAVNKAASLVDIDVIVPSGTAIQNARTTFMGDAFTSDGFHLAPQTGRYIAAATWFQKLTGISVLGNSYRPPEVTVEQLAVMQYAAHLAVKQPNEVTWMSNKEDWGM